MSLVLAIEPDASQADALREALGGGRGTELLLVTSKAAALEAIDRKTPDLILVSALLSPRDEDELMARLRTIQGAAHLQTLTIPQLRRAARAPQRNVRFPFQKKRPAQVETGADPAVFAQEVASYLARAREVRQRGRPSSGDSLLAATLEATAFITAAPARTEPYVEAAPAGATLLDAPRADAAFGGFNDTAIELAPRPYADVAPWPPSPADDATIDLGPVLADFSSSEEPVAGSPAASLAPSLSVFEREAARREAEAEARRRAEAEATHRQAEEEAARRQAEDAAARRRADEAAARRVAEAEAARKQAEAEAARRQAEAETTLAAELERVRREAAEQRDVELARLRAEADAVRQATVEQARAAAETEAREALLAELARVRTEAEHTLSDALSRVREEAEETVAAEVARARDDAEQIRVAELARVQAEADRRQEALTRQAREAAEAEAARAFEDQLSRVRAEAERALTAQLQQARAESERYRDAELARVQMEADAVRLAASEDARAAAEAAAARALDAEVARVRAEAEARLKAELERVRQEAEETRLLEQSTARLEVERLREAAAVEARSIAEQTADRTLRAEIERVRAEADARLACELARLREEADERRTRELEEMRAQVAQMRETAAEQARLAAEAIAAEVARAEAAQRLAGPPPSIVRLTPAPVMAEPASARQSPVVDADVTQTEPGDTPSADYYSLWRAEDEQTEEPASAEEELADAPGLHLRILKAAVSSWKLPAAAAVLLALSGLWSLDIESWVDGAGSSASAAEASTPPPAPEPEPAAPAPEAVAPVRPAPKVGELLVETTPAGARVLIDGTFRGESPLTLNDVPVGRHKLVLESSAGTVSRVIEVRDGERTIATEAIMAGWLSIFSRIPLEVYVDDRRLGSTDDGQLMVPPGSHAVRFASERFNFRATKALEVRPGAVTAHTVSLPMGIVHVNAAEGAEVWIEGEHAGIVPLRDRLVPIGTREIVVRHPALGERRQTVEVRVGEPIDVTLQLP